MEVGKVWWSVLKVEKYEKICIKLAKRWESVLKMAKIEKE